MKTHSFTRVISRRALTFTALGGAFLFILAPKGIGAEAVAQPLPRNAAVPVLSEADLLSHIHDSANRVFNDLINFVCREDIERFKGSSRDPEGHKLDLITSTVSYDSDAEHYTEIYRNNKPLNRISGLQGAWSEGDYGTLLGETIKAMQTRPLHLVARTSLDGVPAVVYSFSYPSEETPWEMQIAGHRYLVPFQGQVWASPETGDVLRVDRIAEDVPRPTGISGVTWSVTFGAAQVDAKTYWLPRTAVYSVSYYEGGRHEWNKIAFSNYRRYGSEVVVHF